MKQTHKWLLTHPSLVWLAFFYLLLCACLCLSACLRTTDRPLCSYCILIRSSRKREINLIHLWRQLLFVKVFCAVSVSQWLTKPSTEQTVEWIESASPLSFKICHFSFNQKWLDDITESYWRLFCFSSALILSEIPLLGIWIYEFYLVQGTGLLLKTYLLVSW